MTTTLSERIERCLTDSLTKSGLARACRIKQPSVSDWLNGRTKRIEGANLLRAADYLGVNAEWLATGSGPMRPNEHAVHEPAGPAYLPGKDSARPLVRAIAELAERIDDAGLLKLQGYAACLLADHPLAKAKHA